MYSGLLYVYSRVFWCIPPAYAFFFSEHTTFMRKRVELDDVVSLIRFKQGSRAGVNARRTSERMHENWDMFERNGWLQASQDCQLLLHKPF